MTSRHRREELGLFCPGSCAVLEAVVFFAEPVDLQVGVGSVVVEVVSLDVGGATDATRLGCELSSSDGVVGSGADALLVQIGAARLLGSSAAGGVACAVLADGAKAGADVVAAPVKLRERQRAAAGRALLGPWSHAQNFNGPTAAAASTGSTSK